MRTAFLSILSMTVNLALSMGSVPAPPQAPPAQASLARTDGAVLMNDQPVTSPAAAVTLPTTARIRTNAGRAVISLKHGGTLLLGDDSSVTVFANDVYNFNRIALIAGTAVVVTHGSRPVVACGTDVTLSSTGTFRFDVRGIEPADGTSRCDFRVYDGAASTPGASVTYLLTAGQRMELNRRAGDMIPVQPFAPADLDEFDRWSRTQAAPTSR